MSQNDLPDSLLGLDGDSFRGEARLFQRNVYILLLNTLHAALEALQVQQDIDYSDLEGRIKDTKGEYQEHLIDRQGEVVVDGVDQERFLRNMALVGLASLLTHTLLTMARSAESFSRRNRYYDVPGIGNRKPSTFEKLFAEFKERFGFDLQQEHALVAFVKPLNCVRNQIVHEGGFANPPKYWQQVETADFQALDYDQAFC